MKKSVSLVLLATILLHSCVAYNKTSVPINEAYERGRVKIKTTNGNEIIFRNIVVRDSVYYGINPDKETRLDATQISTVHLKDIDKSKMQSTFLTIGLVASIVLIIVAVVVIAGSKNIIDDINSI